MTKEKKPVGCPKGLLRWPEKIFLNVLTKDPKSTPQIVKELNEEHSISWGAVNKYLRLLHGKGKVKLIEGKVNLWSKK